MFLHKYPPISVTKINSNCIIFIQPPVLKEKVILEMMSNN
jgi:hypothetical protein